MQITEIDFQNFGPFVNVKTQLLSHKDKRKNITVLIGENGCGKSSILEGITILLSWLVARLRSDKNSGSPIPELKIYDGASFSNISISLNAQNGDRKWNIVRTKKGKIRRIESNLKEVHTLAEIYRTSLSMNDDASLPLIAYYPTERYVLDIPRKIRKRHQFKQINGYETALTKGIDFRVFFEWFRDREDSRNEGKISFDEIFSYVEFEKVIAAIREKNAAIPLDDMYSFLNMDKLEKNNQELYHRVINREQLLNDPQYFAVLHALEIFMPGYSQLRIQRKPRMRMMVNKGRQQLDILQLSQGEKSLLALVGDIARRLAMMNPALDDPLKGEGIILIDEIDLHLHPRWQRNIVRRLRETFPKCQFILTTHSPLVISDPDNIQILLLKNGGIEALDNLYGMDIEQVILEVMDTPLRHEDLQKKLDDLMDAIQDRDYGLAHKLRTELSQILPPDHRELIRADIFLRRQEALDEKDH
jgi:Predicted ATP-binding protein involved in virulence